MSSDIGITKICGICKKEKPLTEFSKNRCRRDGLNWQCRECVYQYDSTHKEGSKKRYQKNKEERLARKKEHYWKNREKLLRETKEDYQNSKEKRQEQNRKWYWNNREERLKQKREYSQTPQGKLVQKICGANSRATKKIRLEESSQLTLIKIQQVYENNIKKYGTLTCELCFQPILFGEDSLEHFTPISRHEEFLELDLNDLNNLGIAHDCIVSQEKCNVRKSNMTLEEWFQANPQYLKRKNDTKSFD